MVDAERAAQTSTISEPRQSTVVELTAMISAGVSQLSDKLRVRPVLSILSHYGHRIATLAAG
jgi:hypothetical protein